MTRIDLRALGWVVTRDACYELARTAFGGRPNMSATALRELGDRWRAIRASPTADQAETFSVGLLTTSLSRQRAKAVMEFVDSMQVCCPDLYSERALRNRCLGGVGQAIVYLALGAILACWTSADTMIVGDAALALFAIASWSVVATIQLWRTHRLIKRIGQFRGEPGLVPKGSLPPPAHRGLPHP